MFKLRVSTYLYSFEDSIPPLSKSLPEPCSATDGVRSTHSHHKSSFGLKAASPSYPICLPFTISVLHHTGKVQGLAVLCFPWKASRASHLAEGFEHRHSCHHSMSCAVRVAGFGNRGQHTTRALWSSPCEQEGLSKASPLPGECWE